MSNVKEVESVEDFLGTLDSNPEVVVKFWAEWCGPCKQFAPHFESASEKSNATFVAVDVDAVPDVAASFGIKTVPTVLLIRDGGEAIIQLAKDPRTRRVQPFLAELNAA